MKAEHPIWQLGLFTKLSKSEAQCNECKKEGRDRYTFKLSDGSIKALLVHLNSTLHTTEYAEKFSLLQKQSKLIGDKCKITKYVNIVGTGMFFIEFKNINFHNFHTLQNIIFLLRCSFVT